MDRLAEGHRMPRSIYIFVGVTFGWSWLCWLPLVLSGASITPGALPTHVPGLLGPAIGALVAAATEGKASLKALLRRVVTLRLSPLGWLAAASPLAFIAAGLLVDVLMGHRPVLDGLRLYPGIPDVGLVLTFIVALVGNGFGEEMGWRGFALQRLQARWGQWGGTIALWPVWMLWHLPLFAIIASYRSMDMVMIVFGWCLGIFAGNLVLANVAHLARGSILAVALWHTLYNFSSATRLGGASPAVATTLVIIWALVLIFLRRRRPSDKSLSSP